MSNCELNDRPAPVDPDERLRAASGRAVEPLPGFVPVGDFLDSKGDAGGAEERVERRAEASATWIGDDKKSDSAVFGGRRTG